MARWQLPRLLRRRRPCPECGNETREVHCEVCGYDLVRKTRDATPPHPGM